MSRRKLILRAPFDVFSGYGNDAVDLTVALAAAGFEVVPWPTSLMPGLPRAFTKLLEQDPRGPGDVLIQFTPPQQLDPKPVASCADLTAGYTMWERCPVTPADLTPEGATSPVDLDGWGELLVTCPMNVDAFAPVRAAPAQVVPCGIDPDRWPVARRDPNRPIRFLAAGMLGGRKDPWALIHTWQAVKNEHPEFDAELTLHTLAPGLHPKLADTVPGLTISDRALNQAQLAQMYAEHDVLVSTSRGEGNNKPAMEFLATGGTVIATDWAGHRNWLHRGHAYPLGGRLAQADGAEPGVEEFHADRAELYELLLHCHQNRAEVAEKGQAAARFARSALTWGHTVGKLRAALGL